MAALTADLPHLSEKPAMAALTAIETKKERSASHELHEPSSESASKHDLEHESTQYQGGVRRVRAITSVWTKQTMWLMFAL